MYRSEEDIVYVFAQITNISSFLLYMNNLEVKTTHKSKETTKDD